MCEVNFKGEGINYMDKAMKGKKSACDSQGLRLWVVRRTLSASLHLILGDTSHVLKHIESLYNEAYIHRLSSSYSFLSCETKHGKQCLPPLGDVTHHP